MIEVTKDNIQNVVSEVCSLERGSYFCIDPTLIAHFLEVIPRSRHFKFITAPPDTEEYKLYGEKCNVVLESTPSVVM